MSKNLKSFLTFVSLVIIGATFCNSCPFLSSIEQFGCDCGYGLDEYWISCETNDFPKVIKELKFKLKYSEKHLEELYLKSDSLETIDQNFFNNISFGVITLHNSSNLKTIDENAFDGIADHLLKLEISGNNQLSDPNIFGIISKMKNLRILTLSDTKLTSIPGEAFNGSQKGLSRISFDSNCGHSPIKTLNKRAFYYLDNLVHLGIV